MSAATCSACGQVAPGGVCMGPHIAYAPELRYGGPRTALTLRVTGKPRDQNTAVLWPRNCIECGTRFEVAYWGPRATCGNACLTARKRRSQERMVAKVRARRAA